MGTTRPNAVAAGVFFLVAFAAAIAGVAALPGRRFHAAKAAEVEAAEAAEAADRELKPSCG